MDKKDLLFQYSFGWMHGAGNRSIDEKRLNHPDQTMRQEYLLGHSDGLKAKHIAIRKAEERLGAVFHHIRLQDG